MDDEHVQQLVIITQTPTSGPPQNKKHSGGDRRSTHVTKAKLSTRISQAINDGLYFYEQVIYNQLELILFTGFNYRTCWLVNLKF